MSQSLTNEQYAETQIALSRIAEVICLLPLEQFIESAQRAEVMGALVDPQLFIRSQRAIKRVVELAQAALELKLTRLDHVQGQDQRTIEMNQTAAGVFLEVLKRR